MALCRVFEMPDGTIRTMHPNLEHKLDTETEAEFVDRICKEDALKDPTMTGHIVRSDMDTSTLPVREKIDSQGDSLSCRSGWRWDGTKIIMEETKIVPCLSNFLGRLRKILPLDKPKVRGWAMEVRAAMLNKDLALLQILYNELKTAQVGATPPLTQAEFDAVKLTITEKKIPLV